MYPCSKDLNRSTEPQPARTPFQPRTPPADDLREYVRRSMRNAPSQWRVVIELQCADDKARAAYGRWAEIERLGPRRTRLTLDVDDFTWPLHILATADAEFAVVEPPELRAAVAATAARFAAAV